MSDITELIEKNMTPTTQVVIIFTLITEAFTKKEITSGKAKDKKGAEVLAPEGTFTLNDFTFRYRKIQRKCYEINKDCQVVLIIPPMLDLIYYNDRHIKRYEPALMEAYYRDARFSKEKQHKGVKTQNKTIRQLLTDQKGIQQIFDLQEMIPMPREHHKSIQAFLYGSLKSLDSRGYLHDGLHPTKEYVDRIWKRLVSRRFFWVPRTPQKPPTSHHTTTGTSGAEQRNPERSTTSTTEPRPSTSTAEPPYIPQSLSISAAELVPYTPTITTAPLPGNNNIVDEVQYVMEVEATPSAISLPISSETFPTYSEDVWYQPGMRPDKLIQIKSELVNRARGQLDSKGIEMNDDDLWQLLGKLKIK